MCRIGATGRGWWFRFLELAKFVRRLSVRLDLASGSNARCVRIHAVVKSAGRGVWNQWHPVGLQAWQVSSRGDAFLTGMSTVFRG